MLLSICPNCGTKVSDAVKTWHSTFQKTKSPYDTPLLLVELFECPKCKTKFTSRVSPPQKLVPPTANVKNTIERINRIREELMQTLKDLRAKIQALETER